MNNDFEETHGTNENNDFDKTSGSDECAAISPVEWRYYFGRIMPGKVEELNQLTEEENWQQVAEVASEIKSIALRLYKIKEMLEKKSNHDNLDDIVEDGNAIPRYNASKDPFFSETAQEGDKPYEYDD